MTDMRHEDIAVVEHAPRTRSVLTWWLAGGLVVALAALVGLGAWVWTTYSTTPLEQSAVTLVEDHMAAVNADDLDAVMSTMSTDMVWIATAEGQIVSGPLKGQEYVDFVKSAMPTFRMEQLGPVAVVSDESTGRVEVSVPTHVTIGNMGADESGTSVYTVEDMNGTPKIVQMVWVTLG